MAVANTNFDHILTTTFERVRAVLADNLTTHSVVLAAIRMAGGVRIEPGGAFIRENLLYGSNPTVKSYQGLEVFDTAEAEGISAARFDWKQLGGTVVIPNIELFQNSGKAQIKSILQSRLEQLDITFRETVDDQLLADGTGNGGKDLGGLDLLVEDGTAWGTGGNIDSSTWTFWRNQFLDFDGTYTSFSTAAQGSVEGMIALRVVRDLCRRKKDLPNLILSGATLKQAYEHYMEGTHVRIRHDSRLADLGFPNIEFDGIPWVYDASVADDDLWMLNTNHLHFVIGEGHNFKVDPFQTPVDQDGRVAKMTLYANMTTSNRARQGRIIDFAV
jgi:hypothetical protein